MPFIDVSLGAGRTPEQVRALIHELTEAAHRAVGAPKESIRVVIREIQPEHWAAGGHHHRRTTGCAGDTAGALR